MASARSWGAASARRTWRRSRRASRNRERTRRRTIGISTPAASAASNTPASGWEWNASSSGSASSIISGTLVTVVMYEHEEIRRGVAKFEEARDDLRRLPDSWPSIQELNRHGIFLVQFLWDHFRKENTSLFPTARKVLSPDALRNVTERISVR